MSSLQIERLETLLRCAAPASEPSVRTALDKIQADLLSRLAQSSPESSDYFLSTLRVLKRIKGTGNSGLRLHCLHHCSIFFAHHGNFQSALDAATQQHLLASQIHSAEACRQALNSMGIFHAELGNVSQALAHYSDALEIARGRNDTEAECVVLNNMGVALNYASLYRDAIPCLEKVLALAQPTWSYAGAKKSYTNLAQSHYYLENFEEALEAIQRSIHCESSPANASEHFDQALREFTLVQIALELDRYSLASEHAAQCTTHALSANSVSSMRMAGIAAARCEVRGGDAQKGLEKLDRLLMECRETDSIYRDALIAAVKAYDEAGQPEKSLAQLEQLLHYVRERRMSAVRTLLALPGYRILDPSRNHSGGIDVLALEHKHAHLRARVAERQTEFARWEMLERLAVTADLKEESSGEHGYRVGKLAGLLARRIGWSDDAAQAIELAARLHDIGKIAIPDKILASSQTLKDAERHFMCMHTSIGAEMLAKSDLPQLKMAETIVRHHHEWWDGSGYPDKLAGNRIPIHARIVSLADVFDALTHGRPYANPWSIDRALAEIAAKQRTQFDPHLTSRFVALIQDLRIEHEDLDRFLSKAASDSPLNQVRKKIRSLLEREQDHVQSSGPREAQIRH